jgi:hypothetical protein
VPDREATIAAGIQEVCGRSTPLRRAEYSPLDPATGGTGPIRGPILALPHWHVLVHGRRHAQHALACPCTSWGCWVFSSALRRNSLSSSFRFSEDTSQFCPFKGPPGPRRPLPLCLNCSGG